MKNSIFVYVMIITMFLVSCDTSTSSNVEGQWYKQNLSDGQKIEQYINIFDSSKPAEKKEYNSVEGIYSWDYFFNNIKSEDLSNSGTYEVNLDTYEIYFYPQSEDSSVEMEPIIRSFIISNGGSTISIFVVAESVGTGSKYSLIGEASTEEIE